MSNKKSLCEVFEFFPDAQWITEDSHGNYVIWKSRFKPEINELGYNEGLVKNTDFIIVDCMLQIDWQHRKTWKERCVSRSEIMEGEGWVREFARVVEEIW